jgi:hypothetical protein
LSSIFRDEYKFEVEKAYLSLPQFPQRQLNMDLRGLIDAPSSPQLQSNNDPLDFVDSPQSPQLQVNRLLLNFVSNHDSEEALFIIYYAGHGFWDHDSKSFMLCG